MPPARDSIIADLDSYVEAYEDAWAAGRQPEVEEFLPEATHPHYAAIVAELLRVDLELRWRRGLPVPLDDYRQRFADVLSDAHRFRDLAYEEYRVRLQAGDRVAPSHYRERYGVDTRTWPACESVRDASLAVAEEIASANAPQPNSGRLALSRDNPIDATLVQRTFPRFAILEELGRGAFGRVFLAREQDLAGRLVALKVTAGATVEPHRLAQMQHANIVPIYSVHRSAQFQAVCMPYLGRCTLADVVGHLRQRVFIPQSGQDLLSTMAAHSQDTLVAAPGNPGATSAHQASLTVPGAFVRSIREQFEKSSYVDAVAWIGAQLAAGLAHAHERGVLHRDLKPANILLADDGRPMLLDFNLADRFRASDERADLVGGTIPYMAPEHLEALETGHGIDARCDVYALGVVLFELLTRQLPFSDSAPAALRPATLAAQRRRGAPSVRALNDAVPRSLDGVIARCLAPRPDDRYQSAEELRTDLERHLAHQPLQFAPDCHVPERVGKWVRRHPRVSSAASLGTVAAILLIGLGAAWAIRERRLARVEAAATFQNFLAATPTVEAPLSVPGTDAEILDAGIRAAERQLDRYRVRTTSNWRSQSAYAQLAPRQQRELDERLATTLYLLAGAYQRRALATSDEDGRRAALGQAIDVNALAVDLTKRRSLRLGDAIQRQRAELSAISTSGSSPLTTDRAGTSPSADSQGEPIELLTQGRYGEALPRLIEWRDRSPADLTAWLLLGNAYAGIGAAAEADECYSAAIVQRPQFALSYFLRGLARYELHKYQDAAADFTKALKLGACPLAARVNRALALYGAKDLDGALVDLNAALEQPAAPVRLYFVRAQLRRERGDAAGAKQDFQRGLRTMPQDATSWLTRGMARLDSDPEAALADFRRAYELDPGSRAAMQNMVHVLADKFDRELDAIPILNAMISANPRDSRALASRAMVHARLGDADAALADVAAATGLAEDPMLLLQAAGVYALCAEHDEERTQAALALLARALGENPALVELAASDPDLRPLRTDPEFNQILDSARILHKAQARRGPVVAVEAP